VAEELVIAAGRRPSAALAVEQRLSLLALAAERERIGRDLHDILGHSLTAIAVKAGLAARLVDVDPSAARTQLSEIEEVARQALTDVRATASGFRQVWLAGELACARSILLAAGIEARVPAPLPPLPDEISELFGYVVREAVTNVVRHSGATTCTIELTPASVRVVDDGIGREAPPAGTARRRSGLDGLAERVAAAGGELIVTHGPDGGTLVSATLPAVLTARSAAMDALPL
jgi:two-component system, NarL family, sensor histidine kinase DesK